MVGRRGSVSRVVEGITGAISGKHGESEDEYRRVKRVMNGAVSLQQKTNNSSGSSRVDYQRLPTVVSVPILVETTKWEVSQSKGCQPTRDPTPEHARFSTRITALGLSSSCYSQRNQDLPMCRSCERYARALNSTPQDSVKKSSRTMTAHLHLRGCITSCANPPMLK